MRTYHDFDAHVAGQLHEVLTLLANQHDCLVVHVPGRVGLVLDHETLQR